MSWSEIGVLYRNELRSALRERSIVVNSILIPLLLYPVLLWVMFSGIAFVMGKTEGMVSRVVLTGLPEQHEALRSKLDEDDGVELEEEQDAAAATAAVRDGKLDLVIDFAPATGEGQDLANNYRVRLTYDGSKDRSNVARRRLIGLLDTYRAGWLREQAEQLGVSAEQWRQFELESGNVASESEVGAYLMGLLLPLILIIMLALGCFYPAIDATAGERERSTWETLMSTGASRHSIVLAKYLYVATMGVVAGMLNLVSMTVSMRTIFAPLLEDSGESFDFQFPFASLPVLALGTVLLALFIAAGMMILASFARSFKEGQSLVSPFFFLLYLPVLALQGPDIKLTLPLALTPVANMMLIFREAIIGNFNLPLIAVAVVVEVVTIVLCLRLAAAILRFEDVVTGSYEGNLLALVRHRLLGRGGQGNASNKSNTTTSTQERRDD